MHDPIDNVVCVGEPSYTVLVEHLGLELYINSYRRLLDCGVRLLLHGDYTSVLKNVQIVEASADYCNSEKTHDLLAVYTETHESAHEM